MVDIKPDCIYNKTMYEWDEDKRAKNILNHRTDFDLIHSFDWATALTVLDSRFDEPRYSALGLIGKRLYFVAYTVRKDKIRLISMRKANKREVRSYEYHISN